MPFNHNDHYDRLLLRQIPNGARTALDVGCGHGRFARRLGQRGLDVDAVGGLRDGLNPGGTLAILGCYDDRTSDRWIDIATPANAVAKFTLYANDRIRGVAPSPSAPACNPEMTFGQLKQESRTLPPGRRIRRLVFWRYLLVYRKPVG